MRQWGEDATTMWEAITLYIRLCRVARKWCFCIPSAHGAAEIFRTMRMTARTGGNVFK
jgi:hypothetical protein